MDKLERDTKLALRRLLNMLVPKGMKGKERAALAQTAGISPETLRHVLTRQSLSADTLLRLLLVRGVSMKALANLPQTNFEKLSEGEAEWLEYGRELGDAEKIEFVALIKYIRARWGQLK